MFEIKKKSKTIQLSFRLKQAEYNFVIEQATKLNYNATDYIKYLLGQEYKRQNESVIQAVNDIEINTELKPIRNESEIKNETKNETKSKTKTKTKVKVEDGKKICKNCKEIKELSEFAINKTDKNTGKIYYNTICKQCKNSKLD